VKSSLPLITYGALTLILFWPIVLQPGTTVPSDLGDPLLSTWTLWWNAHVLPFTQAWWDGLAFFPAQDTITFSDHRLGLGLITTPLIWLGASPLASYNVAFLLSSWLCALGAYALGFTLTRNREAAFIGGLVFGFNPYRAGHLSHIELLSSYWLPIVLLALHQWATSQKRRWLVLLAVALTMQALTSGYYFMFATPLLALWLIWFLPRGLTIRRYAGLAAALALPVVAVTPILLKYRAAHLRMGLSRGIQEIERLSADAIGLITAPEPLAIWNSPEAWRFGENAIFTGATAVILTTAALFVRRTPVVTDAGARYGRLRMALLALAAGAAVIATISGVHGPVAFELLGVRVSASSAYKPLSVATVMFACWVLTSARARQAWRDQSPLGFYVLATVAMWLFALGPTARLLGYRVLYKAPYAWLMVLPGFRDEFRVPARFAMLAALTLSAAAAVAFWRLIAPRTTLVRVFATCVVATGVMLDSWIAPLPVVQPPPALEVPAVVPASAAILELPLGLFEDAIAMYRSIGHQRRTVNGLSGYDAPHYGILREALVDRRFEALRGLAGHGDIAVFIRRDNQGELFLPLVLARAGARLVARTDTHYVLLVSHSARPASKAVLDGFKPAERGLASDMNPEQLSWMVDGNLVTWWSSLNAQRGDESFTADLEQVFQIGGVTLGMGRSATGFPRELAVDVSLDGTQWTEAWHGETAAQTVAAAIDDPIGATVSLPFAAQRGRYIRLRQLGQSIQPWAVAEFRVITAPTQ
jgi:hypothetical protein